MDISDEQRELYRIQRANKLPEGFRFTGAKGDRQRASDVGLDFIDCVQDEINDYIVNELLSNLFVTKNGPNVVIGDESEVIDVTMINGKPRKHKYRNTEYYKNASGDLSLIYENQKIYYPEITDDGKDTKVKWVFVNPLSVWKKLPQRPTYDAVAFQPFSPTTQGVAKKLAYEEALRDSGIRVKNTFKGWGVEPDFINSEEKCKLIREHIRMLCNYESHVYDWVICWIANLFQTQDKAKSAICFTGSPGCGKGTLIAGVLGKIIGPDSFQHTNDLNQIMQKFTILREETLLMFGDECSFVNKTWNSLKPFITDSRIEKESKYMNSKSIESRANYMFATNEAVAAPVEVGDRRYCVIEVEKSFHPATRHEYFDPLYNEINNGGVEAFFGWMLQYDLDGARKTIKLDQAPETRARSTQKQYFAPAHQQWWQWVLENETFGNISTDRAHIEIIKFSDVENKIVPKPLFHASYVNWVQQYRKHLKFDITPIQLNKELMKMCKSIEKTTTRPNFNDPVNPFRWVTGGGTPQCVRMPELKAAKFEYLEFFGSPIDGFMDDDQDELDLDEASREGYSFIKGENPDEVAGRDREEIRDDFEDIPF